MFVSATFIDASEVLSKRLTKADIERFGWIFKPSEIKDISLEEFSRKDCIFRQSVLGSPNGIRIIRFDSGQVEAKWIP
ncbi:hypothetical protein AMS66_04705 [Paenibacillus xylanivorans]|uniref:Uncharacterized protein n=1 Tax=Paenibacillus xylanivorans TaxID=1705561 RepID=A0A0M9BSQ5_9BACL|nr:hypothetical protein AMS66_04705 [Paenibacillus xylanivorans]